MKTTTPLLHTLLATLLLTAASSRAQALQPVNLRSTAGFAVLAGSLVSNIPTSAVTGDIGLSPATGGNITGFGPTEVIGTIYTVDASGPAGSVPAASLLTTAKGDLTLAYNDAAGRTPVPSGPFLNPGSGSGNIGGLTLGPGLYKFTSSASITGSNLTLAGTASDVWIFQIASGLTVGNGIQVILTGGARAANVFWQVGTSAMLGTTSVFKGTILADQSISLNTGASLEGRALASVAAVTLASNAITQPGAATSLSGAADRDSRFDFQPSKNGGFEFVVPTSGPATLTLLNAYGRELAVLFRGYAQAGKHYEIQFSRLRISKGLYFAKLETSGEIRIGRMLLGL
ncbi:MAG: hypothetical protein K0Q91_545 [Fibrobacteria bacterium]|jgi:hypothetical protein|nr:hypothetical protein [Fibrobacteria bacterium]